MKQIRNANDVKMLGTILVMAAHPDDESFLACGILLAAVANNQTVICVTATRGEAGTQDESRWPSSQLSQIRTAEMATALKVAGITKHHWLDYPDGGCAAVDDNEVVSRIAELLEKYQPNSILTFGPDGMTGHPDHQAVSRWTANAVAQLSSKPTIYHAVHTEQVYEKYLKEADQQFNIFFMIDKPPLVAETDCTICFRLSPAMLKKKYAVLAAMPSQTQRLLNSFPEDKLAGALGIETFVNA